MPVGKKNLHTNIHQSILKAVEKFTFPLYIVLLIYGHFELKSRFDNKNNGQPF